MTDDKPIRLDRRSGLLPAEILELGLDDDGRTAWCAYRGAGPGAVERIEVDADDPAGALAQELMADHRFVPLLAVAAARQLLAEHRRRFTLH
jgi:hypothetical protein